MGQRHQLFIVCNANGRYRILAAVHHQWLHGPGPTKTCWRILQLLQHPSNKVLVTHELSHARTRPDQWWDELERDVFWMDDPVQFPFITTCLVLGASMKEHNVSILSITSKLNEIDNNDGLTIIDISDIHAIRYCFAFLDDMRPLTGEQYYWTYYPDNLPTDPIPADLSAWDLVKPGVLRSLWPYGKWSRAVVPLDCSTEKPVRSLRSLAFDKLVAQALDDPEEADKLGAADELPDFHTRLRERLKGAPNLVQSPGRLQALSLSIQQTDHLDLSPYPWLTETQILHLIEQKGLDQTLISLDLSMNSTVTIASLQKILSLCHNLSELIVFYADGLPLVPLLDALDGSRVRRVWHQELFRLSLSSIRTDNSILEHLSFFTRSGNVLKQAISLQISRFLSADLAPHRLANGGLRWSEILIDRNSGLALDPGNRYRSGVFASALPLLDAMLAPADVYDWFNQLLNFMQGRWIASILLGHEDQFTKHCALHLAISITDPWRVKPLPRELCQRRIQPIVRTERGPRYNNDVQDPCHDQIRSGEWTILIIGEEDKERNHRIRYAFLTRNDTGDLVVADLSQFHRIATTSDTDSTEFKNQVENLGKFPSMMNLDSVQTEADSKPNVSINFCEIEEVMDIVSNILEARTTGETA